MQRTRTWLLVGCITLLGAWAGCASKTAENSHDVVRATAQNEMAKGSAIIVLINQSAEPIQQVRVSPHPEDEQSENLLQEGALAVGQSVALEGFPAGTWDLTLHDSSGKTRRFSKQRVEDHKEYSLIVDAYHWE